MTFLTQFLQNESGAITIDWVVLTSSVVGLGIAVLMVIAGGVNDASNRIDTEIKEVPETWVDVIK